MIVKAELWDMVESPVMYVVTTNSFVKKNRELVMGRGAALQAKKSIPGIAYECGAAVAESKFQDYLFLEIRPTTNNKAGFGIFQVKRFWKGNADLDLIRRSANNLWFWSTHHPDVNIRMNYPGIGNGGLSRTDVEPLIRQLAERVTICYK